MSNTGVSSPMNPLMCETGRIFTRLTLKPSCCVHVREQHAQLGNLFSGACALRRRNVYGERMAKSDAGRRIADVPMRRAEVSYQRGEAAVTYDPNATTTDKLREAINQTGYKVEGAR